MKICQITGKFFPTLHCECFGLIIQIKVHGPIDKVDNSHW